MTIITDNLHLNICTSVIKFRSIIIKIIEFYTVLHLCSKHVSYVQERVSAAGICDRNCGNFCIARQERDYIIHVMRNVVLTCWIIQSTDAH